MFRAAHLANLTSTRTRLHRAFSTAGFVQRLSLALVIATATPLFAQETREAQMTASQAEKATRLRPYEPEQLEGRLDRLEGSLVSRRPTFLFLGGIMDGGGLAVGPGYRVRFGDTGSFETHAAWSIRNYKTTDAALTLPTFANRRVSVGLRASWLDAPSVAFYGLGNDSRGEDRTRFSYATRTVGASVRVQAAPHLAVGGGLDSIQAETGRSTQGATTLAASSPSYRKTRIFSEFDWRSAARYTRRGGLYRVEWSDYKQVNTGALSFRRLDSEVQQFIPILRENWVIALRALASTTTTSAGQEVPYFLMPDLGGSHTLRGYSPWRFRDRNRLLLTGEYRWTAGPLVDMALFVDAGKVTERTRDLDWRGLRKTYGIGMSIHTMTSTVTRIEVARTPDGTSLGLSFSPSF